MKTFSVPNAFGLFKAWAFRAFTLPSIAPTTPPTFAQLANTKDVTPSTRSTNVTPGIRWAAVTPRTRSFTVTPSTSSREVL